MKKLIFGKGINIITKNSDIKAILNDRFSLYPDFNEKEDIKLYINENEENDDFISINPNLHTSYPDGFKAKFGSNTIRWVMGQDVIKVYLNIPSLTKSWKNIISRYRSMEFSIGSKERIDQILYEMVLIPTMFFIDNLAIIHSAGFVYKNKSFLLGGTGGTGKTSASLEISKKNSALFLNDDMSIIDSQGFIYPNLAYPKIYAYNTIGDIELENKLIKHHSFLNKIHWKIKKKKNSEKVRRKISPKDLYGSVINEKVKLDFYIILFREKVSKMKITEINKESAINATISIMQSEYSNIFNTHIYWHEYNKTIEGEPPIISMSGVVKKWKNTLNGGLNGKRILKLSIPYNLSNEEYKKQLLNILDGLLD